MSTPIQDKIRTAMTSGGNLFIEFDSALNGKPPGSLNVYLQEIQSGAGVKINLNSPGELANIIWLPWKQGQLTALRPSSIKGQNTLFFTYNLTGCKVFAIQDGPIWHIDAPIEVKEFWPQIANDEWVEDYWEVSTEKQVAYLRRGGQDSKYWDLSEYLQGVGPTTYSSNNIGEAVVGGVVNASEQLDLYFKVTPQSSSESSSWTPLKYNSQKRLK